jgi:anti-anti-sigma regulatory factor
MKPEARQPETEILIRLDGVFDAVAAWRVRGQLQKLPCDAQVVLDFSKVRDFADLGVAVMASGLAEQSGPRVVLRGLRQHQHRMFRYFGIDFDHGLGEPANTPEPGSLR